MVVHREPSGLDALAEVSRQLQANGQHEEALVAQLRQHMDQQEDKDDTPLIHTASAANELAQQLQPIRSRKRKAEPEVAAPVDPQLQQPEDYSSFVNNTIEEGPQQMQQLSQHYAMNHGGFGLLQRANKNKVRGRFSEERRKQVQSVRKKGACIRCRMLKKPCSEGTPCGTCQNIESARLWKNTCIRSRVADEFTLYSTSLFHAKDHHTVTTTLQNVEPMQLPGRIEVTLFPDTHIYATFPALMTPPTAPSLIFMLNYRRDPDTLAATLERYLHMVIMQCISREPSTFMRSTLEVATELSVDHNDVLLGKLINLWAATNILISNESMWSVYYESNHPPVMEAVQVETPASDKESSSRKEFLPDTHDYAIIYAQLQHATERYCQKQAKFVMNELERRLLQRQQSSSFLTFLAAVILLNCVERMTGLYRSFDPMKAPSDLHAQLTTGNDHHGSETTPPAHPTTSPDELPDRPVDWLLEDPPSHFWPQGESFSNLVHLLLRMRGLPPATLIRPNGSLVVIPNSHNKAYSSETSGPAAESQLQLATAWIERTNVSAFELLRVKDRNFFDLGPDPRDWDLRFVAPLLLPQNA